METQPDHLEKELEEILKSVAESENIKNYDVSFDSIPTKGEGFLSEFFTGEVINKDNEKTIRVAVKKAPMNGFTAGLENHDIYKNEICFYSEIIPELVKYQSEKKPKYPFNNVPRYFSGNFASKNIFLTMENLKADGYVLLDKKKFLDSKHLELIFKTYGKLHALSFSYKHKNAEAYKNIVKNFTVIKFAESREIVGIMEKSYLGVVDAFDPITEADILTKLQVVKDVAETIRNVETYKGSETCLIHGDCWSNNMLFKYKESGELEDIKLVDFQMTRDSTPIHDLSYFFYSGASKKDMDKLDYYLDLYYHSFCTFAGELGENPEEMLPFDVFKKEWKQYGMWGVFLGWQLWLIKLMDKDEISSVLDQQGLSSDHYFALWQEKMSVVLKGADFRERTRDICIHAVEYGIL